MDTVHKQAFRIRDLPTRTVTLFPTRAHVVRDIEDVVLKPGLNEIAVVGLSPTVDATSIRIDGTGAAVVADMAVELQPNEEVFEEGGGESEEEEEDDEEEGESSDDSTDEDDIYGATSHVPVPGDAPAVAAVRAQLREVRGRLAMLRARQAAAREAMRSAVSRLGLLDEYGRGVVAGGGGDAEKEAGEAGRKAPPLSAVPPLLATYAAERARAFADHQAGAAAQQPLSDDVAAQQRRETALTRALRRAARRARRARARARHAARRQAAAAMQRRATAAAQRRRARAARAACWPRVVYTVRVTLEVGGVPEAGPEAGPAYTEKDSEKTLDTTTTTISLTLSYHTAAASWAPTYDLQLATATASAVLTFDALLHNHTAETWARCAVVLATSQTTLAGLDDTAVPALVPWRVGLGSGGGGGGGGDDPLLRSREETMHMARWRARAAAAAAAGRDDGQRSRAELFGVDGPGEEKKTRAPPNMGIAYRKMAPAPALKAMHGDDSDSDSDDSDDDAPPDALAFAAAAVDASGLAATYALAGRRTLAPAPPGKKKTDTAARQRVARVAFAGVQFRHTVVAKYKPAAFLRATLCNRSRWTLLRGPVGLTLDGAFLGRATLPRCGPGGARLELGLGVAPGLRVAYAAPAVRRTGGGLLFGKEARTEYRRGVVVAAELSSSKTTATTTTRSSSSTSTSTTTPSSSTTSSSTSSSTSSPLLLSVHDQIPLSQDEKLRVDILQPRGLVLGGPPVPAGVGSRAGRHRVLPAGAADADENAEAEDTAEPDTTTDPVTDWGTAHATLHPGGEVVWEVALQPGRAVRLDLVYEVSRPAGEGVVQV